MDIKWHGKSCFTLKDKGVAVAINPEGEACTDVVLSDVEGKTPELEGTKVFDWPGEYEVKGVPIIAFRSWTKSKSKEEEEKEVGEPTMIFYFEVGGIKCCHMGATGHVLTSEIVNEIGDVDILMIDLGENSNLAAKKAMEIVESIEPRSVIAMGEGDLKVKLKEFGAENTEVVDMFSIKSSSELPEDKRKYILLNAV